MPQPQPVKHQAIEDGLDRIHITELRKRFLQINFDRMLRTRNALHHRQEVFLDVLPLLFHCNHPMLPGFVSHATPAGVSGYKPSKQDVAAGKSLARSFCNTGGHQGENIWGIYIMGSVGTLAHTTHSDFDVWLCYKPDLSHEGRVELQQKCQRISKWADDLRLEVHFFLMNSEAFASGQTLQLDEESSGSAQRALLLDEFYRTALYVAGRLPLWWFAPAQEEHDYEQYTHQLTDKRFLRPGTTLDFGGLNHIPVGEYLGAATWQLYKSIGSPYKSALKLLLMEAYVADYPNTQPLGLEFKQLVYAGDLNVDDLDPYLLVYQRIERYLLEHNALERLELARRCFYFKIHKPLSRKPVHVSKSWQRGVLEQLVANWGWTDDWVAHLDRRAEWKANEVRIERNALVSSLNGSYEALQRFANASGGERAISEHELHILGRKLQAVFERRPGKIDWINPGISKDISESLLKLTQTHTVDGDGWQVQGVWQLIGADDEPLRQSASPVDLLLWCHINQVIDGHVQWDLNQAPDANEIQLRRTLAHIAQWLPLPIRAPEQSAFAQPAVPERALLLINVAKESKSRLSDMGVQRLSGKNDPLRYGSYSDNLVASVDLITLNSWQEVANQRFEGRYALLYAMKAYMALCMPGSHQAPPELTVECLGQNHATAIGKRINQWFHEIAACYYTGIKPPATRYIFELGPQLFSLQFKGPKLHVVAHKGKKNLQAFLSEPQNKYSPVVVDSFALQNHPVKLIAKRLSAKSIFVFYQREQHIINVTVVDEKGSFIEFKSEYTEQLHSLQALHKFLHVALRRIPAAPMPNMESGFSIFPIEFYELHEEKNRRLSLHQKTVGWPANDHKALSVSAMVRLNEKGTLEYNFECLGQHFTWEQLNNDVFYIAAQYVMKQCSAPQRYRIHISDVDLSASGDYYCQNDKLQLCHYLKAKIDIEQKLSIAARTLLT